MHWFRGGSASEAVGWDLIWLVSWYSYDGYRRTEAYGACLNAIHGTVLKLANGVHQVSKHWFSD